MKPTMYYTKNKQLYTGTISPWKQLVYRKISYICLINV